MLGTVRFSRLLSTCTTTRAKTYMHRQKDGPKEAVANGVDPTKYRIISTQSTLSRIDLLYPSRQHLLINYYMPTLRMRLCGSGLSGPDFGGQLMESEAQSIK